MTEKRDEAKLSPIWVPLYEGRLNTCDDCEHETVPGAFIREADAKLEDIDVAKYVPASTLESVTRERDALASMLVPRPGETWDSDRPPIADRVYELFAALSRLGTQDETEPFRGTLRALLCNRETLARRVSELEQTLRTEFELHDRAYGLRTPEIERLTKENANLRQAVIFAIGVDYVTNDARKRLESLLAPKDPSDA